MDLRQFLHCLIEISLADLPIMFLCDFFGMSADRSSDMRRDRSSEIRRSGRPKILPSARHRPPTDSLSLADMDRVIQMAWEDRTTFDAIERQFGLTPGEVNTLT
jgi:hypothetical protein